MIYIKEIFPDEDSVLIRADGILDLEGIPVVKEICNKYLKERRKVVLHLDGIIHISREGKEFLQQIQNRIFIRGF